MGLLKTPDEKAAAAQERAEREFWESPPGQARLAFERGDLMLQMAIPLRSQDAVIVKMGGAFTPSRDTDWSATLNHVAAEGWELTHFSVAFVQTGAQSRDKFMASGQQVAVAGGVVGYYVFSRNEDNWVPEAED